MSEQEIRIAVAKLCGKTCIHCSGTGILNKRSDEEWTRMKAAMKENQIAHPEIQPDVECDIVCGLPRYTQSLDACAEMEATLKDDHDKRLYANFVFCRTKVGQFSIMAPPITRCSAFLQFHNINPDKVAS